MKTTSSSQANTLSHCNCSYCRWQIFCTNNNGFEVLNINRSLLIKKIEKNRNRIVCNS